MDRTEGGEDETSLGGWLVKRGAKRKNWKVRWFERQIENLVYSAGKGRAEKGSIALREVVSVMRDDGMMKKSSFFTKRLEKDDDALQNGKNQSVSNEDISEGELTAEDAAREKTYDKYFHIKTEKRTYFLAASSEKEREKWIKGIERHAWNLRGRRCGSEAGRSLDFENRRLTGSAKDNRDVIKLEQLTLDKENRLGALERALIEKYKEKKKKLKQKLTEQAEKQTGFNPQRTAMGLASSAPETSLSQSLPSSVPSPSERDKSLLEVIENLQSKLTENEELIAYQKTMIKELEKAKAKHERLAKEAEKRQHKAERDFHRKMMQEIRARAAMAASSAALLKTSPLPSLPLEQLGIDTEDEAEASENEASSDDTTFDSDSSEKKEWEEEDDGEDELVEMVDQSSRSSRSTSAAAAEEPSDLESENTEDESIDERYKRAEEISQPPVPSDDPSETNASWRRGHSALPKSSSDFTSQSSMLSFSPLEASPQRKPLLQSPTSTEVSTTQMQSRFKAFASLNSGDSFSLPVRHVESYDAKSDNSKHSKTWERPDQWKRLALVKGIIIHQASKFPGDASLTGMQIHIRLSCPELSSKSKSLKVDTSTTMGQLQKRKPLANWHRKLQMKKAKEFVLDHIHYGLYLPTSGEQQGTIGIPEGIWLEENEPLWRYDLDEGALLEFRGIEADRHAALKHSYILQIICVNPVEGGPPKRTRQLFKFNKYTTVGYVLQIASEKLEMHSNVEHYGLLLHKKTGIIWLNPDNILAAYHLQDMDLLELKARFLELSFQNDEAGTAQDPLLTQDRLLLDSSSMSVLEATHCICNWLGIERKRWQHYNVLVSGPNATTIRLKPGCLLAQYTLATNTVVMLELDTPPSPKSKEAEDTKNWRSYTLSVKFSPHFIDSATEEPPNEPPKKSEDKEIESLFARFCIGGEVGRQHLSGVGLVTSNRLVVGTLYCTNYALMFNPQALASEGVRIPLGAILRISKIAKNTLLILCKDFRPAIRFRFSSKNLASHWHEVLGQNAFPGDILKTFAFHFKWEGVNDGWGVYNTQEEFKRQTSLAGKGGKKWRMSDINKDYRHAPTYPEYIGVPERVLDQVLLPIFEFRSKGRIPALSYIFRNGASITRSSQPMVGFRGNSCPQDEFLLHAIFQANPNSGKKNSILRIFDARPRVNAMANQAMGAGVEKCGPNCRLEFLNIGNIHVMRDSYNKLQQLCVSDPPSAPATSSPTGTASSLSPSVAPSLLSPSWLSNLERTKWLDHLSIILTASTSVALSVYQETSVLIHCSDGWDRTPQVSALAQLMLDRYYRSIRGFAVLIEKEFLSFGHKFSERYGHTHPDVAGTSQRAPIFPQFLDLVYQLTQQFPCAFEFNERFLIFLIDHLYSCQFGTFLCNSQKERENLLAKEKTVSLWSFILNNNHKKFDFVNPFYAPEIDVCFPATGVENLVLWKGFYFRHTPKFETEVASQYAKQVTVDLRAMQLISTIESLNEKLHQSPPPASDVAT